MKCVCQLNGVRYTPGCISFGFPNKYTTVEWVCIVLRKKALVIMSISPDFDFNLTFLLSEVMKSRVP